MTKNRIFQKSATCLQKPTLAGRPDEGQIAYAVYNKKIGGWGGAEPVGSPACLLLLLLILPLLFILFYGARVGARTAERSCGAA